jgi:hypothetical protein
MGSTRRSYTPEYQEHSAASVIDGGRPVAEVAGNIQRTTPLPAAATVAHRRHYVVYRLMMVRRCSSRRSAPTGTPAVFSTEVCHGQTSRPGSAGRTVSGFLRTPSVPGRDFTRPDVPAHGHMTDRQDHKAGDRRDVRRSGYILVNQGNRSVKPSAQPTLVRTQHLPHAANTAR